MCLNVHLLAIDHFSYLQHTKMCPLKKWPLIKPKCKQKIIWIEISKNTLYRNMHAFAILSFFFFSINNFTLLQTNFNLWLISMNWPLMCTSIHYPSTSEAQFLYQHESKQSVQLSGASLSSQALTQHLLRLHTGSIFTIVYPFMLTNQSWSLP